MLRSVADVSRQLISPISSRVKLSWTAWPFNMGLMGCPETSVTNPQSTLRNIPEEGIAALCIRYVERQILRKMGSSGGLMYIR